ncbi:MAG: nucleotidyltransferase family protein [Burkholderiales bacterium]
MSVHAPDGPARQLLGALRGGTGAPQAGPADWGAIAALACEHGVAPLLHRGLERAGGLARLPEAARAALAAARRDTAARNLLHYAEFRRIADAMAARALPLMALKGLHLAELVYGDISLRPMADVDFLVPEARVDEAAGVLRALGYGEGDAPVASAQVLESTCALGFTREANGVYVELHWKLSEPADGFAAPMREIWQAAQPCTLGGAPSLAMSPEFLLLHVGAHLACKHLFILPLRALADIDAILGAHPGLDWDAFARHAASHGWGRGVALALRLAREQLDAPVPDRALAAVGAHALAPGLVAEALAQMLDAPRLPAEVATSPNFLGLAGRGAAARIGMVLRRVFVPRAELAQLYGVSARSPRLLPFYAVRLRDLVRRYGASARELDRPGSALRDAAARRARLSAWIGGGQ